jgi:predicted signal transduction protein with EAL and GGDEF domain
MAGRRVGGQTIGSVLVSSSKPMKPSVRERVQETVAQAPPILANQRNLALAETLARCDSLTGLANRRAADEALERMTAQGIRSSTRETADCANSGLPKTARSDCAPALDGQVS